MESKKAKPTSRFPFSGCVIKTPTISTPTGNEARTAANSPRISLDCPLATSKFSNNVRSSSIRS